MKKLKLIPIALIALSISFITSCRKKGCSDLDADNYDSQAEKSGTCYFRYGNKVVIIAPNSINWDNFILRCWGYQIDTFSKKFLI